MSVYVDDMEAPFRGMVMCHMVADSHEELIEMAELIGVKTSWIQHEGTYKEHFDISKSKRDIALREGAVKITWRELGLFIIARRNLPENVW